MKVFSWQAKNEVVLLNVRSSFLRYIFPKIWLYIWILAFWIFSSLLFSYIVFIFSVVICLLFISYEIFLWTWVKMIVTQKRVLKFVRTGLFSTHFKELKLLQLTEISAVKRGLLNKILNTWNVKFIWKDKEAVIWFKYIKYPEEVAMYVSRLKEFLLENKDFDPNKLNVFIPRKNRNK